MNVAIAQVQAVPLDTTANIRLTIAAAEEAAASEADLLVLPELVASGYVTDDPAIADVAEPSDGSGPVLSAWIHAAQRLGLAIIGGYPELDGDRLFNSVAVIDKTGAVKGGYRKLHLFGPEKGRFVPGDLGLPVFSLEGVTVGVAVCYDLRFPEVVRLLAIESGADLIAVPTAWVVGFDPAATPSHDRVGQVEGALVQANLNQVYVACADLCGSDNALTFLGRSLVASPYGECVVGPLSTDTPGVAVAQIDKAEVSGAQDRGGGISPRADRRTDVYSIASHPGPADTDALLSEIERRRGYVLDLHRTLARLDPAFLASYDAFLDATFLAERTLDRRVKELVYIGALTAQGTDEAHLVAHMRAAVAHGSTEREVLEVLEQVLPPAGVPRFIAGLQAFNQAFPAEDLA
jgi:predicted amidohydrolase/alkylhydroperoxidase/carboxymuconolactone decarboxylase family protein YurZ